MRVLLFALGTLLVALAYGVQGAPMDEDSAKVERMEHYKELLDFILPKGGAGNGGGAMRGFAGRLLKADRAMMGGPGRNSDEDNNKPLHKMKDRP